MFAKVFDNIPVGRTVVSHWAQQDVALLDSAASVIEAHHGDPWVFAADERHFDQFAGDADKEAFNAMTPDQRDALCYWCW